MACLDTTFLIDLIREQRRRKGGSATRKLHELETLGESFSTTLFTVGELYAGLAKAIDPDREGSHIENIISSLILLPFHITTARFFGFLYGGLRARGMEIGVLDAMIASVALENDETLITRNVGHFGRIPLLKVESY